MGDDLQQLQGTWQAVRIESGGQSIPADTARQLKYVFAGNNVTLIEAGKPAGTGVVTLDPGATPKAITVVMTDGPGQGQTAAGIFRIVGGVLTLCIGGEQPADFGGAGSAALIELERTEP